MSGIYGVLDRRDGVPTALLDDMSDALAHRGPAVSNQWRDSQVGLGVRGREQGHPLARRPALAETPHGPVAVVVAGTPTSRERFGGGGGGQISEEILGAYMLGGVEAVTQMTGAFAIAIWDGRAGQLCLIRDRLGNQPLYVAETPNGLVFASERKSLFRHGQVSTAVDANGMRELFSYAGTAGHGIFRAVQQVEPGTILTVGEGNTWQRKTYWRLQTRPHTDNFRTTVATVRDLLERNVAREMGDGTDIGILLSGGVDSSSITGLAHGLHGGGSPLRTFTVNFAEEADFIADEVWGSPDAPFVRDMVRHVGAEHRDVTVSTKELLDPVNRMRTLIAKDVPSPLGNMNTSLMLLYREVGRHVGHVLLGEIADAIFGGFAWMHVPELAAAKTLPWVAMGHYGGGRHGLGGDLLAPDLLATLDLNGYCEAAYQRTAANVEFTENEDPTEQHMRVVNHLHLTAWLETLLSHDESLGAAVGVEARMPFCDHELVEYVYNAPWAMKSQGALEKSLLRTAVQDLIPDSVINRKKSPFPVTQDPAYGAWLIDSLTELAADSGRVDGLINIEAITALRDDPSVLASGPRAWVARANAEMALGLARWVDEYDITLTI